MNPVRNFDGAGSKRDISNGVNDFIGGLESYVSDEKNPSIKRGQLTTLQVNLGDLCNQSCQHCHIGASPQGKNIMSRKTIDDIVMFLSKNRGLVLDITGGAPELNPYFDYFISSARPFVEEIIVRSNLTVFFGPGKEYLPQFFKDYKIHLICSLPCYTEKNVDNQRGDGAFKKSIKALRLLNDIGFAEREGLCLDLVYNPCEAKLPPKQEELEKDYKRVLKNEYGVEFNKLITITNVPIKRFKNYLKSRGEYNNYLNLLKDNFNPSVLDNLMCRSFLSVGYDGRLYDCDFNQALCLALEDKKGNAFTIEKLNAQDLEGQDIILGEHCFACTAGYGSSCQGVLTHKEEAQLPSSIDNEPDISYKKDTIKAYYGKILRSRKDLKTSACCPTDTISISHRQILKDIDPEILEKFYGCGSPLPPLLEGTVVLDLGCGTGRDVYLASRLTGERGFVIGVDMTDEQLNVAHRHRDAQMARFGFSRPNVEFKKGYIEDLKLIGIEDSSVDVVISNCVINLSPDKRGVFSEIFRALRPGGELYFADIFAGRRIPENLKSDPVLYGECLGGALYIEDFRRILREVGCPDYRVISKRRITIDDPEIKTKVGGIDFYSMTIRAFKLTNLEDICEDYGQVAIYQGMIPECQNQFMLDDHHIFVTGKPMPICGNTASMIGETRYAEYFTIIGDRSVHYGPFPCAPASGQGREDNSSKGNSSCC